MKHNGRFPLNLNSVPLIFLALIQITFAKSSLPSGVWHGVSGTDSITICFNGAYESGSFYLAGCQRATPIQYDVKDSLWHMYKDTVTFKFQKPQESKIAGLCLNKKRKTTQPVLISLIDGGKNDTCACRLNSFIGPLEKNYRVASGKIKKIKGHSYRSVYYAGLETIEIMGEDKISKKINEQLLKLLGPKQVQEYREERQNRLCGWVDGDDIISIEPVFWNRHLVTIRFYCWLANRGSNGISWDFRTWNLKTGEEVDLSSWFVNDSGSQRRNEDSYGSGSVQISEKLQMFLYKSAPKGSEETHGTCFHRNFDIVPEENSICFSETGMGSGCELTVNIPFRKLYPVLTKEGKEYIDLLLSGKKK